MKSTHVLRGITTRPRHFWDSVYNQKQFFDRLAEKLNLKTMDDWYEVTFQEIVDNGGTKLLRKYKDSTSLLLSTIYPDHKWLMWKFPAVSKGFWNLKQNHREFMEKLGETLGFKSMEDWYRITSEDINKHGGAGLIARYGNSPPKLVMGVFTEHSWNVASFETVPKRYWESPENQKTFLDWLGERLGVKEKHDWYKVRSEAIKDHGGSTLLHNYDNSLSNLFGAVYPDHAWLGFKFGRVPSGYWESMEHQKMFLDELGKFLGMKKMEDWYNIRIEDVVKNGGGSLLRVYSNSPSKLLEAVYSDHKWDLRKFDRIPMRYWDELMEKPLPEFVEWLGKELKLRNLDDWYRVSFKQIEEIVPLNLLRKRPLDKMLQEVYPEHAWDLAKLQFKNSTKKASQRMVAVTVAELFPNTDIREDYTHEDGLRKFELDIYLARKRLAFEYLGEGHFQDLYAMGEQQRRHSKIEEKRSACRLAGITLVEVPYWWDMKKDSLQASINEMKNELIEKPATGEPIPKQPPAGFPSGSVEAAV